MKTTNYEHEKFLKDYQKARDLAEIVAYVHTTYGGLYEDTNDPRDSIERLDGLNIGVYKEVRDQFRKLEHVELEHVEVEAIVMVMRFLLQVTATKAGLNNRNLVKPVEFIKTRTESGLLFSNGVRDILVPYSYAIDDFSSYAITRLMPPMSDAITLDNILSISNEIDQKIMNLSNEYPDITVVPGFFIRAVAKLILCNEKLLQAQCGVLADCFRLSLMPKLKKEYDKKIILMEGATPSDFSEEILQPELNSRSDFENIIWKKAIICGMEGYLTYERLDKSIVPLEWNSLELRHDVNSGVYQIAENILVDLYGTFLVRTDVCAYVKLSIEQKCGDYLNIPENAIFICPGTFCYKNNNFINIEK